MESLMWHKKTFWRGFWKEMMDAAWNVHVRSKKRSCPEATFGLHFDSKQQKNQSKTLNKLSPQSNNKYIYISIYINI